MDRLVREDDQRLAGAVLHLMRRRSRSRSVRQIAVSRYAIPDRGNAIPSVSLPAPVNAYPSSQRGVTGRPATIAASDSRRETCRERSPTGSDCQVPARSARAPSVNRIAAIRGRSPSRALVAVRRLTDHEEGRIEARRRPRRSPRNPGRRPRGGRHASAQRPRRLAPSAEDELGSAARRTMNGSQNGTRAPRSSSTKSHARTNANAPTRSAIWTVLRSITRTDSRTQL